MQDYGLAIKFNDGEVVYACLLRMLKVFLCINPKQEYVRSIVHQILTLVYWRKKKVSLPFWNMFKNDVAKFNEEPIELSFSLLGRSLTNDGLRNKLDHVRKKYRGVKNYILFKKEFELEFLGKDTMKSVSGRFEIKVGNQKLGQVRSWLLDVFNKCRYNVYHMYKSKAAFESFAEGVLHSGKAYKGERAHERNFRRSCAGILQERKDEWRDSIENNWADTAWGPVWDDFKVVAAVVDAEAQVEEAEEKKEQVAVPIVIEKRGRKKQKIVEAFFEADDEEDSDDRPVGRAPRSKPVYVKPNFNNQLADEDRLVREEFAKLERAYQAEHGGKSLGGAAWHRKWEDARDNVANRIAAEGGKRKRAGNTHGFYDEHRGNELDLEAALQASALARRRQMGDEGDHEEEDDSGIEDDDGDRRNKGKR